MQIETVKVANLDISAYSSLDIAVDDILTNHLGKGHCAIAINPEKVIKAQQDPAIAEILSLGNVLYADGIGVVKVMAHKLSKPVSRIPGCELWQLLMEKAGSQQLKVFIVGGGSEVNTATCRKLVKEYGCHIVGSQDGYFTDQQALIEKIIASDADIVSVALGSPKQEILINKCISEGSKAFYMGVGGTYNVYTGNVKRAPKVFSSMGLEWLYRLLCEPSRVFRQRNLVTFAWLALTKKL
jgi:UDP-N-acetyl-D-mannosaminouronate:lipid I N-acetyl-D-mannosaminouronosyltransferase